MDRVLASIFKLHRIKPLDEFFLFERKGRSNSAGFIVEMERLQFSKFKQWARTVFAERYPMAKSCVI